MKINYIVYLSVTLVLSSCNFNNNSNKDTLETDSAEAILAEAPENSSKFIKAATNEAQKLLMANKFTPFEQLQIQKLDRIEENSDVTISNFKSATKTGNQMYYHLQESTMMIGSSYLCSHCPNVHLNIASGFVINEDGVIVTNYHVIEEKEGIEESGVFAVSHDGTTYAVSEILSASQSNDIAILKLETQGKKLKALPLAEEELVGEDVYMMGHPFSNTFFMTKGIISRKYISERSEEPKIAITAEFGQGASGGPVVNEHGQIVGVVSATYMHYTNGGSKVNGDLQLVVKEVVPVSALNNYIKK